MHRIHFSRHLPLPAVLLCLLLHPQPCRSQDSVSGAVSGVAMDLSGSAAAGAAVDLEDAATGTHRTAVADRLGEFYFSQLPPGVYAITVTRQGNAAVRANAVVVEVGRATRLKLPLRPAGSAQVVDVQTDAAPAFDPAVNAVLSPQDLQELPQDGRRFQSLAPQTPLVSGESTADAEAVQLSVRGLDPALNRYTLDGVILSRLFDGTPRGGSAVPFSVPLEAVQEFQVRAVGSGTETGRDAGGSVATVTRRGEAGFHGSAFILVRNSGVGAANPFSTVVRYNNGQPTSTLVKPRDQREQFGGALGGRLFGGVFGFVAGEGQRRSFPAISSPADPNFFQLTAVQTALLANRGVGAAAAARGLQFLDSLTGPVARSANEFALFPRLDFDPGKTGTVTLEAIHLRFRSPAGQNALPVVARGSGSIGDLLTHTDGATLRATASLHPRWRGELRASYSRDASFAQTSTALAQEPHTGPQGAAPQVDIQGAFSFGDSAARGTRRLPDERITQVTAQTRFSGRAHAVSMGGSLAAVDERVGSRGASSGQYDYTSGTTGGRAGGLVDFLTDYTFASTAYPNGGCPSIFAPVHLFCFRSFTQSFGSVAETRFHTAELTGFASDNWRATPNLQVSLGVRYEWNRLPPSQHPNAALDAAFADFGSTSTMPSDTNNLAPHLGISYAPGSGTVVRAGYGFHFGTVPGVTLQRVLEETARPESLSQLRITPRTIIDPACTSAGTNFGYPGTYICAPFGPVAATGSAWFAASGFQMPAVQTGEVSVSQQVAGRAVVSASYVLGLDRQLTNTTDLNVAPSGGRVAFRILRSGGEPGAAGGNVFNVPLYTGRRSSAFGPVTGLLSNGNGTYHALAVQAQAAVRGVSGRVSWTYSKAIDNVPAGSTERNADAQLDPVEPLYDRAVSNFDRRHRVFASAVVQPAVGFDSRSLRLLANGWALSPVLQFQSGRPYSYNLSGGSALPGGRESLNGSGGSNYLPSVGRNTLRFPWSANVDLRLSRSFRLRERADLRLLAEAFNLANHVNPTRVEQRAFLVGTAGADGVVPLTFQSAENIAAAGLNTRPFGTFTESASSITRERRVQVGFRLSW